MLAKKTNKKTSSMSVKITARSNTDKTHEKWIRRMMHISKTPHDDKGPFFVIIF